MIWTTPTHFDYNWTVRGDLIRPFREKIKQASSALDPAVPAQAEILKLQRASRFIETRPENYQGIKPPRPRPACWKIAVALDGESDCARAEPHPTRFICR